MEIDFSKSGGLIPAIAQEAETGKILMLAYINREALEKTIESGRATYWSRSKGKIWIKGEESGNYQEVVDILTDCDSDTIIYSVKQHGLKAACHKGYESCFYRHYKEGEWVYNGEKRVFDPEDVYSK